MDFSVQFSSVAQSCPTLCDPILTIKLPFEHKTENQSKTIYHQVKNYFLKQGKFCLFKNEHGEFPDGPQFHCQGHRFNSWSRNEDFTRLRLSVC